MRIGIISGNPKQDGLCQSIINAIKDGATKAGAEVDEIRLCDLDLKACQVCGDGWGMCARENRCSYGNDGFDDTLARIDQSNALVFASPVYWGEVSETLKIFLDRLRRCQYGPKGILRGKQTLIVASPGGSGNGLLSTLEQLDRFCRHTGATIFDYIGINRWNRDYKQVAAEAAAFAMASGRKNGDTV